MSSSSFHSSASDTAFECAIIEKQNAIFAQKNRILQLRNEVISHASSKAMEDAKTQLKSMLMQLASLEKELADLRLRQYQSLADELNMDQVNELLNRQHITEASEYVHLPQPATSLTKASLNLQEEMRLRAAEAHRQHQHERTPSAGGATSVHSTTSPRARRTSVTSPRTAPAGAAGSADAVGGGGWKQVLNVIGAASKFKRGWLDSKEKEARQILMEDAVNFGRLSSADAKQKILEARSTLYALKQKKNPSQEVLELIEELQHRLKLMDTEYHHLRLTEDPTLALQQQQAQSQQHTTATAATGLADVAHQAQGYNALRDDEF